MEFKNHDDDVENKDYAITFDKLFWLFLIGSVMGVVISAYLPFNTLPCMHQQAVDFRTNYCYTQFNKSGICGEE